VEANKPTDKARESANNVNALGNHWIRRIGKQLPQPYSEFGKNLFLRGEAWYHPILFTDKDGNKLDNTMPIIFSVPDPLVIFASEDEQEIIVFYKRNAGIIEGLYSKWKNNSNNKQVDWMEYWTKDVRYFEADGEPVLKGGIQKNVLGLLPFIHAYSGFGKMSPDGDPASLAVGRLDNVEALLIDECQTASDISATIHKFAHVKVLITLPTGVEVNAEELKQSIDMGAGTVSVVQMPEGGAFSQDTILTPPQEVFQHFYNIRQRIATEAPPIMAGLPSGTSGRQEDIIGTNFIRRYDSVVEAIEVATGKMMNMGLEMLKVIPDWLPITEWMEKPEGNNEVKVTRGDLDSVTESRVVLKAADPIENDRKFMAGRAMRDLNNPQIDWETFLIDHVGYTPEKAHKVIVKTLAEKAINSNPMLLQALQMQAMEDLGMGAQLQAIQGMQKQGVGSQGGEPRNFNLQGGSTGENLDAMLRQGGVREGESLGEI
jgi:hypothetical protein